MGFISTKWRPNPRPGELKQAKIPSNIASIFKTSRVFAFFGGFLVVSQVSGVYRKVQELQGFQDLGHLSKSVHGCPKTKPNTKVREIHRGNI